MKKLFLTFGLLIFLHNVAFATIKNSDFFQLCEKAPLQEIQDAIASGAKINARDEKGKTPLMVVVSSDRDMAVTELIIKSSGDVKARDADGRSALMYAAKNTSNPDIIAVLVRAGSEINAIDKYGNTPLIIATEHNTTPAVTSALIKSGAKVNVKDSDENTPLMKAVINDRADIVELLLEAGAEIRAKNKAGETALTLAKDSVSAEVIKKFEDKKIIAYVKGLSYISSSSRKTFGEVLDSSLQKGRWFVSDSRDKVIFEGFFDNALLPTKLNISKLRVIFSVEITNNGKDFEARDVSHFYESVK